MKKLLFVFLAFSVLAACNNNKTKADKTDLDKSEKENKEGTKDDKSDNKDENKTTSTWTQEYRDQFLGPCVDNAYQASGDRSLSEHYCECMLNKLEELYPDVQKAEARGSEGLQEDLKPYIEGCRGDK